jgi:hypothetical protein
MKTRQEIENLKMQWVNNPIWDLETTEGFEEYSEELKIFSMLKNLEWKNNYREKLVEKARQIGVPGNIVLAEYIMKLENRIEKLENKK